MGNLVDDITDAFKSIFTGDISIDNYVFRMHRSFTVLLCVIFASIMTLDNVSKLICLHTKIIGSQNINYDYKKHYLLFNGFHEIFLFYFSMLESPLIVQEKGPKTTLTRTLSIRIVGYTEPTRITLTSRSQMIPC